MYVLLGEERGDYEDFYQRPKHVLAVSEDEVLLERFWNELPPRTVTTSSETYVERSWEDTDLVDYEIVEVPKLNGG